MRRFALPLALSLAAHAGLLGLMWALPQLCPDGRPRGVGAGRLLPLNITMVAAERPSPPRPAPPPARPEKDWVKADVEPVLIQPTAHADVQPLPSGPGGTDSEGGPGAATPNVGLAGPTESSVLPVSRQISRVVYLLDRSVSMGPSGALARARRELALSLRALPPGTRFQVFAYNRNVTPLLPADSGLVGADAGTVEQTIEALEQLGPTGSTDHVAALKRGLALRPEVLFLLTDADNQADGDFAALRRYNTGGTAVHVIELSRLRIDSGDGPLARLAATTGGTYRRVQP
jgi:hypothetical protein